MIGRPRGATSPGSLSPSHSRARRVQGAGGLWPQRRRPPPRAGRRTPVVTRELTAGGIIREEAVTAPNPHSECRRDGAGWSHQEGRRGGNPHTFTPCTGVRRSSSHPAGGRPTGRWAVQAPGGSAALPRLPRPSTGHLHAVTLPRSPRHAKSRGRHRVCGAGGAPGPPPQSPVHDEGRPGARVPAPRRPSAARWRGGRREAGGTGPARADTWVGGRRPHAHSVSRGISQTQG